MTSAAIMLLILTVTGAFVLRPAAKLAPFLSEYPAKTALATFISAFALAGEFGWVAAPTWVSVVALIVGPLFILGPLLAVSFAKIGWHAVARALLFGLYWTPEGRNALGGVLTEFALAEAEVAAARKYGTTLPVLELRLLLAEHRYDEALALEIPTEPVNNIIMRLLKIEALVATGRLEEAEYDLHNAREFFAKGVGLSLPMHREHVVAHARVAAARGNVREVTLLLSSPYPGLTLYTTMDLAAEAAENQGDIAKAIQYLQNAGPVVPRGKREEYVARLARLGSSPKYLPPQGWEGPAHPVFIMAGVLAVAYVGQLAADQFIGMRQITRILFNASSLIGAYILDIPVVPYHDAWWRFFTYAFVHGNVLHIGMNLWVLIDIGRAYLSRRSWPYLVTSFVAGTAGGAWLTMVLDSGPLILVGASGGILGIAGALLADALLSKQPQDRGLVQSLVRWMALLMLISVAVPGISLYGHAGGIVAGFAWGALVQYLPKKNRIMPVLGWLAIIVMAVSISNALWLIIPLLK